MAEVWTREKVEEALLLMQDTVSLNTPIGADERGGETELEFLIEDTSPSPEELAIREQTGQKLREYMAKYLKAKELEVLERRFGLNDNVCMTLEEIGQEFGITRERVRQLEERGLRRLRQIFLQKNITMEDI